MTWTQIYPALTAKRNGVFFPDEGLNAQPHALVRHRFRGRLVHQMPVLDALNARSDRTLNGGGRVRVRRDVSVAIGGRLHAGAKLGLAERQHVQGGARRRHASASDKFYLRRALEELLAHPQAHFVGAVGDIGGSRPLHGAHWTARAARQIG